MQDPQGNPLLSELPPEEKQRLVPLLRPVRLRVGQAWPQHAYDAQSVLLPAGAVAALVHRSVDGTTTLLACGAVHPVLGIESLHAALPGAVWLVHHEGAALAVDKPRLLSLARSSPVLQGALDRVAHDMLACMAQASVCNRHHELPGQVAHWLLDHAQRRGVDALCVTQKLLGQVLGARRESVSRSIARLAQSGAIVAAPDAIRILDMRRLAALACDCARRSQRPGAKPEAAVAPARSASEDATLADA